MLIQSNPLIVDDELGLLSGYGLRYVHTDPAVVMPQPGGDALVMRRDVEGTADEIARWSAPDAAAFRELLREWSDGLAAVHGRWSSGFDLGDDDAAVRYRALREQSAWDVVHQRFSHPTVRSFMLWLALATIQDPRRPGTVGCCRPNRVSEAAPVRLVDADRRVRRPAGRAGPPARRARRLGRLCRAGRPGARG